jgi:hypothetical protein
MSLAEQSAEPRISSEMNVYDCFARILLKNSTVEAEGDR